jgi:Sec-independent protein translocase protein TatA
MAWVIAVFVVLLLLALITFCTINAVRIIRDMNKTVATYRRRLEDDANAVLEGLFNANPIDDATAPSVNRSQSTATD